MLYFPLLLALVPRAMYQQNQNAGVDKNSQTPRRGRSLSEADKIFFSKDKLGAITHAFFFLAFAILAVSQTKVIYLYSEYGSFISHSIGLKLFSIIGLLSVTLSLLSLLVLELRQIQFWTKNRYGIEFKNKHPEYKLYPKKQMNTILSINIYAIVLSCVFCALFIFLLQEKTVDDFSFFKEVVYS